MTAHMTPGITGQEFRIQGSLVWLAIGVLLLMLFDVSATAADQPVYRPPTGEDLTPARVLGGTNRGSSDESIAIAVIAPDHTGLTLQTQPTLYWHLSRPVSGTVTVTIQDHDSIDPLLEVAVQASLRAGIVELPIEQTGAKLKEGTEYQWSVSVDSDSAGNTAPVNTSGIIKRVTAAPAVRLQLEAAPSERKTHVHAANGIWYDAMMAASAQIRRSPESTAARALRTALLQQIGLSEAASLEIAQPSARQQLPMRR